MPLMDHFHRPLETHRRWESMHSSWANAIVEWLNAGVLPKHYFAAPQIHLGGIVAMDVGTFGEEADHSEDDEPITTWPLPKPTLRATVDFADLDLFEIQVVDDEVGRLVAAIEIVSPANKDRPNHRKAFTIKCASYLQQGLALVIIDVVTDRAANLHESLLKLLKVTPSHSGKLSHLYASSYRTKNATGESAVLESWVKPLAVGLSASTPMW